MENLILVNGENILSPGYQPDNLVQDPKTKIWLKKETYQAFYKMNMAVKKAGFSPLILVSGYRAYSYQKGLFNKKLSQLMEEGLSEKMASKKAGMIVALPGSSEHQTGLAIDITNSELAQRNDPLIKAFEATKHGKWLKAYGDQYGFVLRYPKNKIAITNISYEPWHYRYVGISHAKKMNQLDICLEEYITYLNIKNK